MSVRANIILDQQNWSELQQFPRGERSRVVNAALADWLRRRDRRDAIETMDKIRAKDRGSRRSAESLLQKDRRAH